jgi:polar amino acid transport system permease protein
MNSAIWDWGYAWSILPALLDGVKLTIVATFFGSLISFALGLVWTFLRLARLPIATPAVEFFVQFVRGTPLLVQLYFLFFVFPNWGFSLPPMTTGVLGLGIFYSAYTAEIYRAGIEDLPLGQWEAALVLSLPIRRVWGGIVLPQSIRKILPMLGNQVIGMFKESALLSTITVMELLGQAKALGSLDFRYIEPLTLAGIIYFVISYASARALHRWEGDHALGS